MGSGQGGSAIHFSGGIECFGSMPGGGLELKAGKPPWSHMLAPSHWGLGMNLGMKLVV